MDNESLKEFLWPANGYLFREIELSPVMCKPKLIPLKSMTLEKLEKMQSEAMEKLKEMQEAEEQARNAPPVKEDSGKDDDNRASVGRGRTDIWQAD